MGEVPRHPGTRHFFPPGEKLSALQLYVLLKYNVVCHIFNYKIELMETERGTSHLRASPHDF